MIFTKKVDNLDILRKKVYFYLRKYILSPFLKENEEKDEVSKLIERYIDDKKNELPDEELYEIVEKEYDDLFNKDEVEKENKSKKEKDENIEMTNEENEKKEEKKNVKKKEEENNKNQRHLIKPKFEENKKSIDKFNSDMPFQIIIRKDSTGYYYNRAEVSIFDSKNFPAYNKGLKEYLDIKKFSDPFSESKIPN